VKIIKNEAKYEILMSESELRAQLLKIEKMGRISHQSEKGEITEETAKKFIRARMRDKEDNVIEHGVMSVRFFSPSRGLTHELVRHRLASFIQESTRYVEYVEKDEDTGLTKFELRCVAPPNKDEHQKVLLDDGRKMSLAEMFGQYEMFYRGLRKAGWLREEARQALPIGIKSEIGITTNFREWRHIFTMRTTKPAHWEIRGVMGELLKEVQNMVPVIFDDFVEEGVDSKGVPFFIQAKRR
jgi:thymidylate synthase (FAD)